MKLQALAIPAAVGLAVALAVACQNGPTQESALAPEFSTRITLADDDGNGGCKNNVTVLSLGDIGYDPSYDLNGNDIICEKISGGSGGKKK